MSISNLTMLTGHVGNDSTVKIFTNGNAVVNFSVATKESWKDKEGNWQNHTDWHNCTLNCNTADIANSLAKVITKGRAISVQGSNKSKDVNVIYKEKETVLKQNYVKVDDFKILDKANKEAE